MTARQPTILIATSNPHKVEEIAAVLTPMGFAVESLADLEITIDEPVEDAPTFEGNARIKALYYARHTQQTCLADDSGLEVDALNGEPGVRSARYAGIGNSRPMRDGANNEKLLRALKDVPFESRSARFVCAMCVASPDGRILAESRGEFPGFIIDEPRGKNGFGYDPLLYLPDVKCTSAELSPADKNARSHRGQAVRAIAPRLADILASASNDH